MRALLRLCLLRPPPFQTLSLPSSSSFLSSHTVNHCQFLWATQWRLTSTCPGYTTQVLGDALTYADHAGRPGTVQMEDVTLAIQSRVGWEFGGRVPKEVRQLAINH